MNRKGFTLLEIVIVVAIIALLGVAAIMLLNPMAQIQKTQDSKKVTDLDIIRKALEDFYNDKNCYPTLAQICYLGGDNGSLEDEDGNPYRSCYICGKESQSPTLEPYLNPIPCDPNHPNKKYIYYLPLPSDLDCPNSYKLYSDFNLPNNPTSIDVGCATGGCGVPPFKMGYDYGVTSENVSLDISLHFYCLTDSNSCDNCNAYANCMVRTTCIKTKIYGSFDICCLENPDAVGC